MSDVGFDGSCEMFESNETICIVIDSKSSLRVRLSEMLDVQVAMRVDEARFDVVLVICADEVVLLARLNEYGLLDVVAGFIVWEADFFVVLDDIFVLAVGFEVVVVGAFCLVVVLLVSEVLCMVVLGNGKFTLAAPMSSRS